MVTNTNLQILQNIQKKLRLGKINKNIDKRTNNPIHCWRVSDGHAYLFFKKILPYLKVKKEKTQNAIQKYESNNWRKIKFLE